MIEPGSVELIFAPTGETVRGLIVPATDEMVREHICGRWWTDESLKDPLDPLPIDRYWDWTEAEIDYEGRVLSSQRVAVIAGESEGVQGAMLVSTDPVNSVLAPGEQGLFVELLFTAPRNRKVLRKDGKDFLKGVGFGLLRWAAWLSHESGHGGRLLLDASPESIVFYERVGFLRTGRAMVQHGGVEYLPMELLPSAARELLKS